MNVDLSAVVSDLGLDKTPIDNLDPEPRADRKFEILERSNEYSKKFNVDNSNVKLFGSEFVGVSDAFNILVQIDQFLIRCSGWPRPRSAATGPRGSISALFLY